MYSELLFLEKYDKTLFCDMCTIFDNITINPDVSAFKIRKNCEKIVNFLCKTTNIESTASLFSNIDALQNANLPNQIYMALQRVRKLGNVGVHTNNLSHEELLKLLDAFLYILQWYLNTYITSEDLAPFFNKIILMQERRSSVTLLNETDEKLFSSTLEYIKHYIEDMIIRDKLDGWGVINQVLYISFEEYFTYYMQSLSCILEDKRENEIFGKETLALTLLNFKMIAKRKYGIYNDQQINKLIAEKLYNSTYWYIFKQLGFGRDIEFNDSAKIKFLNNFDSLSKVLYDKQDLQPIIGALTRALKAINFSYPANVHIDNISVSRCSLYYIMLFRVWMYGLLESFPIALILDSYFQHEMELFLGQYIQSQKFSANQAVISIPINDMESMMIHWLLAHAYFLLYRLLGYSLTIEDVTFLNTFLADSLSGEKSDIVEISI